MNFALFFLKSGKNRARSPDLFNRPAIWVMPTWNRSRQIAPVKSYRSNSDSGSVKSGSQLAAASKLQALAEAVFRFRSSNPIKKTNRALKQHSPANQSPYFVYRLVRLSSGTVSTTTAFSDLFQRPVL